MARKHFNNLCGLLFSAVLVLCGCTPAPQDSNISYEPYIPAERDPDNIVTPPDETVSNTKVRFYDGPSLMESASDVEFKVENHPVFVYETLANHARIFSFAPPSTTTKVVMFDFDGPVKIDIDVKDVAIKSALVRPLAYATPVSFEGSHISFTLAEPGNYVLEYNNDPTTAIQIFSNRYGDHEEIPEADDSTIVVQPGLYDAGAFPIKDGTTIYLCGGAYVYGSFSAENMHDITIKGRGIVSGSIYSREAANKYTIPLVMRNVTNLRIEDVTFLDPAGWTLHLWKCTNVLVKNVRIITARANGDGISIQSCTNVEVDGGYVRSWDDSLVVKNSDLGSTSHIRIHDVIVWTDLAQSMEVGYETYGPTMDDIIFENITVVHNFHKAVISMHNCDQAIITNVTYKNITVEDGQMLGDNRGDGQNDFLIDFTIAYNEEWTKSQGKRGAINGVTIENVKVLSMEDTVIARMLGDEEGTDIQNVTIRGLQIEGKAINNAADLGLVTNSHVKNVNFESLDKVVGAVITLPYKYVPSESATHDSVTIPTNTEQDGVMVPSFSAYTGDLPFIGVAANVNGTISTSHGVGSTTTTPADDGSGPFVVEGHTGDKANDGNLDTSYISGAWKDEKNEFAAWTMNFDEPTEVGVIRIKGNKDNTYSYTYTIQVWARRIKTTDGTMNPNFTRLLTAADYTMSPASGNIIDILVPAQQFGGIQLRFVKKDGLFAPKQYEMSEIEFYPPSLTFGKTIVDATEHFDVYPVDKLVDGDATGTSYYESVKNSWPVHIVIDMGDVYNVSRIVLSLPPSVVWTARTQNIEILGSDSNVKYSSSTPFTTAVAATDYLFDPQTGNRNIIDVSMRCRFLKLVINSNTGGYGAQLSEVSAYGTK